ncbi:hypothetical protein Lser_V15G38315 [Lactuca serriola]
MCSLSYHKLRVQDIRGQEYDGASNMCGEWNGLQALLLKECPYAYYIHCFAHQLQLALVAASKDVTETDIATKGSTSSQKGDAIFALKHAMSFDFVIVLHMMKDIMGITDKLCQSLQQKSIDIINALALVSTTKILLQKLKDEGWQSLLDQVVCFCKRSDILVPDMNETYKYVIRTRRDKENITAEHHYRVELFIAAIDSQLQELNSRFDESVTEFLRLSVALDPKKSLNVEDICKLATTYYPLDFTEHEIHLLKLELRHYELDMHNHPQLKNSSTLSELCRGLHETGKAGTYPLFDRLIRIILTLPVSTATSERAFSAMKIVKTRLHNTMNDDFLKSCMLINIEREIVDTFSIDKLIDDFSSMKQSRAQLKVRKRVKMELDLIYHYGRLLFIQVKLEDCYCSL